MSKTHIVIDRRPLLILILERSYRFLFLLLIGFSFYYFINQSPWNGLSPEGYRAIGAFLVCMTLWITQLIPLAITGLLAIVIVPLVDIMPTKEAFSYFGNEAVFFILGALILSAALMKTGLSTRLAVLFLGKGKSSPRVLIWRILISCTFLSCIMPEHAVAAFFLPIILEMVRALEYEPFGGSYGRSLFVAMAWGCIIGGLVTFLGGARVPLALGIIQEMTSQKIGFFDWMKTTLPLAIPLVGISYWLILTFFKVDVESVAGISKALEKRKQRMGLMDWKEKWVAFTLAAAIFAWCFYGSVLGLANVAIAAAVFLFVFRVVTWSDVEGYVNWGIILMYGGAICLGRALDSSGAMLWIVHHITSYPALIAETLSQFFPFDVTPALVLIILLSFISLLLSELISNVAVVAILLPVSLGLASSYGMDPTLMAYVVAVPAGIASVLAISTPPMALAYSSGYLKTRDLILPGIVMNLLAWFLFVLLMIFWWPVIGITY